MTRISGCTNNISACSEGDRAAHAALSEENVRRGGKPISAAVTPNGPTRGEVKQREDGAIGGSRSLARKAGEQIKDRYKENPRAQFHQKMIEKYGGLLGKVLAYVKNVSELHKLVTDHARETGVKLDQALQRDALTLFVLTLVQAKLSPGYAEKARVERPDAQKLAEGVLRHMHPEKARSLCTRLQRCAEDGVNAAKQAKLMSDEALQNKLKADPKFAARYEEDCAFRLGVQSALFEARQ